MRAAVEPDGGREEEADFLGEGGEARGGAAGGGDEGARVDDAGEVGVFVIEGEEVGGAGLRFVVGVGGVQGGVVGDAGREGFPAGQGGFELRALGGGFGVAEGEGASVEVVAPFAGLSSLDGRGGEGVSWGLREVGWGRRGVGKKAGGWKVGEEGGEDIQRRYVLSSCRDFMAVSLQSRLMGDEDPLSTTS